jgi:hypothetical protein
LARALGWAAAIGNMDACRRLVDAVYQLWQLY